MDDVPGANSGATRPEGWWRWDRWGRWISLVVVCIVGGSFVASEPRDYYSTVGKVIGAWIAGALVVAALIHLLGLGRHLLRKRRGHASTFPIATYSPLVLTAALVIAVLSAGGRYVQRRDAAIRATGLANGAQLDDAQNAFIIFEKAYVECQVGPGRKFGASRQLTLADERSRHSSSLGPDFSRGLSDARAYRGCLSHLPSGTADLGRVVKRFAQGGALFVEAWTLYVRGFGPPQDQAMLDRGDALEIQAGKQLKLGADSGDALYHRLGGAALLGGRIARPPGS